MDSAAAEEAAAWSAHERFMAFVDRSESILEEKGHADAVRPFQRAIADFQFERVTLAETQATLDRILKSAEAEPLRAELAAFLDAPLGTEEQQDAARAALLQILGGIPRAQLAKNHLIIEETWLKIHATAEANWLPGQGRKFVDFLHKLYSTKGGEEGQQNRRDLLEMAASVEGLQELLTTVWREKDKNL
ncbi:hypothetical protein GGS24DRAFT_474890 [Hypoxylon argillaceum]|nr:hypothetical protein GGS24DRAFT_474890 [Hypoxylon argillaceum]KAI1151237.1 hypothetical protein F4825DRAFT_423431 [Nemania diffusa]